MSRDDANTFQQFSSALQSKPAQHGRARRETFVPSRRSLIVSEKIKVHAHPPNPILQP